MVATGLLKFDIFEESDKTIDGMTGHPMLENNPITTEQEISKQVRLFEVIADESRDKLKSSSDESG